MLADRHFNKTYRLKEEVTPSRHTIYLVPEKTEIERIEILKHEWIVIESILDEFGGCITNIIPKKEKKE
jgi:hypothetical protein